MDLRPQNYEIWKGVRRQNERNPSYLNGGDR